jgi:hypothetical protein
MVSSLTAVVVGSNPGAGVIELSLFVSQLCSKGFSLSSLVFFPCSKTSPNFNLTMNQGFSVIGSGCYISITTLLQKQMYDIVVEIQGVASIGVVDSCAFMGITSWYNYTLFTFSLSMLCKY